MSSSKHPKGLYVLFVTEMWERFSYYGMRAIFILYMTKALLFDKDFASLIYGNYTGLVYLTPLLGGYVADRYWGNRKSIFFGGILMAIGQLLLFISALNYTSIAGSPEGINMAKMAFYGGLGFLIFGNGFFKPNISTMVGQLYPKGDNRMDSAMTIFYMGINLGAFIAPLVAGGLGDTGCPEDFKWGFLAASIGMIISLITFELLKNKYIVTPEGEAVGMPPSSKQTQEKLTDGVIDTPEEAKKAFDYKSTLGYLLGFVAIAAVTNYFTGDVVFASMVGLILIAPLSIIMDKTLSRIEKERIGVIYICAAFVIFFWSAFEQAGASLTFFAEEQTNRNIGSWEMPSSFFQSFNALFIVIFAPIMAWLWTFLDKKGKEPASPFKQAIGLFLLALGYLFIAFMVKGVDPGVKVSMFALIGLYWLHTMGELTLSPIGLSMVVKLSPVKFTSLLMGVWFLSMAFSNKLAGVLSGLYPEEQKVEMTLPVEATMIPESIAWGSGQITSIEEGNWLVEVETVKTKDDKDSSFVTGFTAATSVDQFPKVKAKRVLSMSKIFVDEIKVTKECNAATVGSENFAYASHPTKDEFYVLKQGPEVASVEIWNLNPTKPTFLGKTINTLYDFFMIFVGMAGAASVILFLLGKKLVKMMNGMR